MLDAAKMNLIKPLWVVIPDVVGDREATIRKWEAHHKRVREYGWPLAFAVQDGMNKDDVPHDADVVFVGGSDTQNWKWRNAHYWCEHFQRVHIGRDNSVRRVQY